MLFPCVRKEQSLPVPVAVRLHSASCRLTHNRGGLLACASMKKIPLFNSDQVALVSERDYGMISPLRWWLSIHGKYMRYAATRIDGREWRMHWLIKPGVKLDHKDCNGLNNQRFNLRACTNSQNGANRIKRRPTSSKFKGVCWRIVERKWMGYITKDQKKIHLGYFTSERAAARAYNRAAKRLFGPFARINKV